MPNFRILAPGVFQCSECGQVHQGPFGKQDVRACVNRHAHGICDTSGNTLPRLSQRQEHIARPRYGDTLTTGDGYNRPDKYGRWRVGHSAMERRMIAYFRAQYVLGRREYTFEKFLDSFFDDGTYPKWFGKVSPLQRLSYAYTQGLGWDAIRQAAYDLAYDSEVKRKVEDMFNELLGEDIDDNQSNSTA